MSTMVFDAFPCMAKAQAFVDAVKVRFGLDGSAFEDPDDAEIADVVQGNEPLWIEMRPPIVHIDQPDTANTGWNQRLQHEVMELVLEPEFDGHFCGM